jgi:hypothetical protein
MATSIVQICNTALARIGVSNFIDSINEASQEAQVCKLLYEQCRDRVLREAHWPFARAYATLALVSDNEGKPWANEWQYAYRYPTDAMVVWRILTPLGPRQAIAEPFDVGYDSTGRMIFTNMKDAAIEYTKRVEDVAQFDPSFSSALAWLLAAEISMPLSAVDALRKQALQMYQAERDMAHRISFNEGEPTRDIDTEFLNTRGYASNTFAGDDAVSKLFPSGFSVS